jgi:hypothetical protein
MQSTLDRVRGHVIQADVTFGPDADTRAPGGAVTVALCARPRALHDRGGLASSESWDTVAVRDSAHTAQESALADRLRGGNA